MPCMNSSGEITEMAKKILIAMTSGASLQEIAGQTETPLYRIRSAARELVEAGFAVEKDQNYVTTEAGLAALNKVEAKG
ncbi:MAG: hypothetical protein ACYC46_09815 [Acidobacteriaceae bacterium]